MQRWSADAQRTVTPRVVAFVKGQKFEKQGRFEKVLPALGHLMKNSELITVLLISDGTEIHGTPFDDRINVVFKTWRTQQENARMPFVTVMRAQKGKLTDCLVNPAPWVVDLPPLPTEPQLTKATPKPAAAVPSKTAASPPLPPLVITGKKAEPVNMADTNAVTPASTLPAANSRSGEPSATAPPV